MVSLFFLFLVLASSTKFSLNLFVSDCNTLKTIGGVAHIGNSSCPTSACSNDGSAYTLSKCISATSVSDIVPKGFAYVATFSSTTCATGLADVSFYQVGAVLDFGSYASTATCANSVVNITTCNKILGNCQDYLFKSGQCSNGVYGYCPK